MFKEAQTTEAAGSRISTRTHARDEATWEKKRDDRCQQGADLIPKPIAGVAREVLSRLRQGCLRLADGIEALVPDALGTRTYLQGRSGKFVAAVFFARHKQTQPVHPKKPGMRINRHAIFRLLFTCGIAFMSATGAQGQFITTDFPPGPRPESETEAQDHPYVGMWVTEDGHIRHLLLDNGRYDEARGTRESAWQGRYRVTGDIIQYWDDTGFYADGQFRNGVLYHAGYIFYPR